MFRQVATWRKLTKWPDEISVLNFWIFVIQIENLIYQNLQDDVAKIIQYIGKNGKNETLRKLTKFKFYLTKIYILIRRKKDTVAVMRPF